MGITITQGQPDWLFYDSQKQIVAFTASDTGDFEIDRLCQGYDTIYKTQVPEGRQKRTLVLEDFTAKQWSAEKKSAVKQKLLSLMSQGFDIYIYQSPKPSEPTQAPLLKLSTENIDLIDSPTFKIPLIKKQAINELMKTINVPADQVAHLDTTNLKELLGDNLLGITIQELTDSGYSLEVLKDYLKTTESETPIFNTLYTNDHNPIYRSNDSKVLEEFQQFFRIQTKLVEIWHETPYFDQQENKDDSNLETLLQQNMHTLKNLSLRQHNLSFFVPYLKNLEYLSLYKTKISYEDLVAISRNNSHLKTLVLKEIEMPDSTQTQIFLEMPLELKELETLSLSTNVSKDLRSAILDSTRTLKKLTLNNSQWRDSPYEPDIKVDDISKYKLQDLEEFILEGDLSIEREEFSAILKKSLHLKKLKLTFSDSSGDTLQPEDIPEGSLTNLSDLYTHSKIDTKILAAIFKNSTKLKSLKTQGWVGDPLTINTIPDNILKNLEKAELQYISLNPDETLTFLKKMTHLRELGLFWNDDATLSRLLPEHFPVETLKNLTKCDINYSKVSLSLCQHILEHAKNLDKESVDAINKAIEEKALERIKKAQLAEQQNLEKKQGSESSSTASDQSRDTSANDFPSNTGMVRKTVDANTRSDVDQEYTVRQIFKGINCPDPSHRLYRLEVYDTVTVSAQPSDNPFDLGDLEPDDLVPIPNPEYLDPQLLETKQKEEFKRDAEFNHYLGKTPLVISHNRWTPLPSLSPREALTHFRITSGSDVLNNDDYEFQYSKRRNLCYIKRKTPGPAQVNIELLLKKPAKPVDVKMPAEIAALVKKYRAYPENPPNGGKLTLPDAPTGTQVLEALQTQGIGACRHRTIAFKKEVESLAPDAGCPVRIADSVSHSFVEVQAQSGDWVRYDLGGYPADTVLYDETGKPIPKSAQRETEADSTAEAEANAAEVKASLEHKTTRESKNQEEKETKEDKVDFVDVEIIHEQDLEGNPFKTWESHTKIPTQETLPAYILEIAQGKSPVTNGPIIKGTPLKKILVKFDSEAETEAFRLLVQKQMIDSGKQVYYISSPEDLICSAPWTERNLNTNKGVLRQAHYPPGDKLRRFLKAKHPNPVLVVNWANFKAADIVRFNSLLDKKRKADGVELPDNTLIVGLHTKKPGAYNGEDFFSRSGVIVTFPFNAQELITAANDLVESRHTAPKPSTVTTPPEQKTEPQEQLVQKTELRERLEQKTEHQEQLEEKADPQELEQKTESQKPVMIDLYDSPSWKSLLLGTWCLKGKDLIFEKGPLSDALKSGKALELKNAPWHLEEFRVFWQQARLHQKINVYGEEIPLPPHFKIHTSEGYQWEKLLDNVTWNVGVTESKAENAETYMLNPSNFNQYFKNYISIPGNLISLSPGWIQKAAPKTTPGQPIPPDQFGSLSLLLTRELSQHQWGQLLAFAKEHHVKLNIRVAPGVSLPDSFPQSVKTSVNTVPPVPLETKVAASESKIRLDTLEQGKGHVLIAEDADYAIAVLKNNYPKEGHPRLQNIKIMDISECEARHLFVSRTPRFNKSTLDYKFIQEIGPVLAALEKGETVVLKGRFKPELIDALAPLCSSEPHFWLNGKRVTFKGKLVLVTDNKPDTLKHFSFASTLTMPSAKTTEDLFALLQADTERRYLGRFSKDKIDKAIAAVKKTVEPLSEAPNAEKHSFVKLQSLIEHQLCYPRENPENNWQGLYTLNESEKKMTDEKFSVDAKTAEESTAFEQKRLAEVNDALKFRPFVFIAGSTGAGKSTFIKQILAKQPDHKVFFENQLHTWAKDRTPDVTKTLFIDEANIDKGNFSAFEGLFETPPRILIGNTYYTLTAQHKVVFAGNPLSYGSRKMPELFARRGGSIIFRPLPPSYLYSRVLKPILSNPAAGVEQKTVEPLLTEAEQKIVGEKLLQVYQYISRLPSERVLISPRELEMMASLVIKKYQDVPQPSIEACIVHAVHTICSGVVPKNHEANFLQWCEDNGLKKSLLPAASVPAPFTPPGETQSNPFVVTESRKAAYNQIVDFLSVRTLKQTATANEPFKYAGLGGMILEGEPGVGKSHFVVDTLVSQGFREKHWQSSNTEEQPVQRHQTAAQISKPKAPVARWRQDERGRWEKIESRPAIQAETFTPQWRQDKRGRWHISTPIAPREALPQKIFYQMPVSMPLAEKKKLLLQAFDEGAVVVIDEINSSALMEDLLNDLLMGIYGGRRPNRPGFMIIGTQNPISMAGRTAATVAFERRFLKMICVSYMPPEMKEILEKKGLGVLEIDALVEQYRKARSYAIQNNKKPIPTFRDVLQIVDFKIEALQRKRVDEKTKVAETKAAQETPVSDTKAAQEASADDVVVMPLPETGKKPVYKKGV